jgi:hypothetical protein
MDYFALMIKQNPHLSYPRRLSQKVQWLLAESAGNAEMIASGLDVLYAQLSDVAPSMVERLRKDYDPRYLDERIKTYQQTRKDLEREHNGQFEPLSGTYAERLSQYGAELEEQYAEDVMTRYAQEYEGAKHIPNKQQRQIRLAELEIEMGRAQQQYLEGNDYKRLIANREMELQRAQKIERLNSLQPHPLLED